MTGKRESGETPGDWMDIALEEAQLAADRGDIFVGAVVVKDGRVLGRGGNRSVSMGNPLRHAETSAIEAAIAAFGVAELAGATLYSTMEPCPYCAWAAQDVKIAEVVIGTRYADIRHPDFRTYTVEALMRLTERDLRITTSPRAAECLARRLDWMRRTARPV